MTAEELNPEEIEYLILSAQLKSGIVLGKSKKLRIKWKHNRPKVKFLRLLCKINRHKLRIFYRIRGTEMGVDLVALVGCKRCDARWVYKDDATLSGGAFLRYDKDPSFYADLCRIYDLNYLPNMVISKLDILPSKGAKLAFKDDCDTDRGHLRDKPETN